MSTRCMINFCDGEYVEAKIYRHCDGYPGENGVDADLEKFFAAVEKQCHGDPRFDDPCYLAAKFVVWQASELASENPLDFLGLGVSQEDHGDVRYVWFVDCGARKSKYPTVRYEER